MKILLLLLVPLSFLNLRAEKMDLYLNNTKVTNETRLWLKLYKLELKSIDNIKIEKFKLHYEGKERTDPNPYILDTTIQKSNIFYFTKSIHTFPSRRDHLIKIEILKAYDMNGKKIKIDDIDFILKGSDLIQPSKEEAQLFNEMNTHTSVCYKNSPIIGIDISLKDIKKNRISIQSEYDIEKFNVLLVKRNRPTHRKTFTSNEIDFTDFLEKMKPNDYLMFESFSFKDGRKDAGFVYFIKE